MVDTLLDSPSNTNSPAGDFWTLYIVYIAQNDTQEKHIPITFLPTGEVDIRQTSIDTINSATKLLAPSIHILKEISGNSSFDGIRLLNWIFVTDYWLQLSALGQTAPTLYSATLGGRPNFSHPTIYLLLITFLLTRPFSKSTLLTFRRLSSP